MIFTNVLRTDCLSEIFLLKTLQFPVQFKKTINFKENMLKLSELVLGTLRGKVNSIKVKTGIKRRGRIKC